MATDITLEIPEDGVEQLTSDWLNTNLRDALYLILSPATCILTKSNTMTYAGSSTWTAIVWDTVAADTEDPATPMYSSSHTTRITITTPGYYEVSADICMTIDNAGNGFSVGFRVNGSTYYIGDTVEWSTGAVNHATSFVTLIPLSAGDYIETVVRMSRTTSLTSTNSWNLPRMAARRVRGLDTDIVVPSGPFINAFTLHTATGNYTAQAGKLYLVDCSKSDIRVTLPPIADSSPEDAMVFKRWKGPNDVILIPQSGETVNGLPNGTITDGLHLSQDGQGRWCIPDTTNGGWVTY